MRVYLDTSVCNRPFDDQTQPRIWLETQAVSLILQMIESGAAELITSTVITYENSRNPHEARRNWVQRVMSFAVFTQVANVEIKQRAQGLESNGFKALDALHVASAEAAKANCFVTCDDRLLRRYRADPQQQMIVCTPTEFVENFSGE